MIRTDNEPVFTSRVFRLGLQMLGIRHSTTDILAPWQNGRIERLLGTFKRALQTRDGEELEQNDLEDFRLWYNHLRPHQHLAGRTPAETWDGPMARCGRARLVSLWNGRLVGVYTPR